MIDSDLTPAVNWLCSVPDWEKGWKAFPKQHKMNFNKCAKSSNTAETKERAIKGLASLRFVAA